jgi:hypothetical protein
MQEIYDYLSRHVRQVAVSEEEGIDLIFFKVQIVGEPSSEKLRKLVQDNLVRLAEDERGPDAGDLKEIIEDNEEGEFEKVNLFDGKEHSYIQVGAWIGDQGAAMGLMALGTHLGLWDLLTPMTVLGRIFDRDDPMVMQMAGMGMISIIHNPEVHGV